MLQRALLLFSVPFFAVAQIKMQPNNPVFYSKGQIIQDTLFVFSNSELWSYPLNDLNNPKKRPIVNMIMEEDEFLLELGLFHYASVQLDNQIYFIQNRGGKVYQFQNDSITRIDRSFTHRMQINSNLFTQNNTLYRYGGYGFWSMRNFFTFFSLETNEWESISPANSEEFPKGSQGSYLSYKDDEVILFGGFTINPNNLNHQGIFYNEVWKFNFKNLKWTYLGPLLEDFSFSKKTFKSLGDALIFKKDNQLIKILPFENKVIAYQPTVVQSKWIDQHGILAVYKKDNIFYSFLSFDNSGEVKLIQRNADEFYGEQLSEEKLYRDYSSLLYLLLILVLPVGVLIRKRIKVMKSKIAKIQLNTKGLVYKKVFFEFEEKELEVINLLLNYDVVHSSEILALVENPNHNYSHNMRTKNQLIDKLNYKLKTMLKIDYDLITSEKSKEDRRIIDYMMDKTFF